MLQTIEEKRSGISLQNQIRSPKEVILALDPGGTTGWVKQGQYAQASEFVWGQLEESNHHNKLWSLLTMAVGEALSLSVPCYIVYERFEFRHEERDRDKIEYISAEYNGVVKLFGQNNHPHVKLVEQGASQAKDFFTDDKLRHLGLWVPGKKHARDAMRHLLYFITFTQGDKRFLMKLKDF